MRLFGPLCMFITSHKADKYNKNVHICKSCVSMIKEIYIDRSHMEVDKMHLSVKQYIC